MFKKLLPLLAILVLAACSLDPTTPDSDFTRPIGQEPLSLKVRSIDVVSEFTPTFTRPHIEHLLPISIERNARTWARENLEAADPSSPYTATFVIKDASMTENIEQSSSFLRRDQAVYKATLSVVLRIADSTTLSLSEASITAWKELSIPANLSIDRREAFWNKMINDMLISFNEAMRKSAQQNLSQYINGSPAVQQ